MYPFITKSADVPVNAQSPISETFFEIVTSSSDLQSAKALVPILVTPSGIIIFFNDVHSVNV